MIELKSSIFFIATCLLLLLFASREIKANVYSSFKPNYPFVAVLNCSIDDPNIFYDLSKQKWMFQRYSTCSKTEKDVLSLCERVYPQYYIKSVVQYKHKTKYFVNECNNATRTKHFEAQNLLCQYKVEYTTPFKCLYEEDKSDLDYSESYEMPLSEFETTFRTPELDTVSRKTDAYLIPGKIQDDQTVSNIEVSKKEEAKSSHIFLNIVIVLVLFSGVVYLARKIAKAYKNKNQNDCDFNLNDPALQDDHVNNMQVNGYENPAYKLYEQNIVT